MAITAGILRVSTILQETEVFGQVMFIVKRALIEASLALHTSLHNSEITEVMALRFVMFTLISTQRTAKPRPL